MRDQEFLFTRHRRHSLFDLIVLKHISTDPNQPGEPVRITQPGFPGHQATLRKTRDNRLFTWEALFTEQVQQFEQHFPAARNSRPRISRKIVPRVATEVTIRRIHQHIVQPRQPHHSRHPAIPFDAVAQPVHHQQQISRILLVSLVKFRLQHPARKEPDPWPNCNRERVPDRGRSPVAAATAWRTAALQSRSSHDEAMRVNSRSHRLLLASNAATRRDAVPQNLARVVSPIVKC